MRMTLGWWSVGILLSWQNQILGRPLMWSVAHFCSFILMCALAGWDISSVWLWYGLLVVGRPMSGFLKNALNDLLTRAGGAFQQPASVRMELRVVAVQVGDVFGLQSAAEPVPVSAGSSLPVSDERVLQVAYE